MSTPWEFVTPSWFPSKYYGNYTKYAGILREFLSEYYVIPSWIPGVNLSSWWKGIFTDDWVIPDWLNPWWERIQAEFTKKNVDSSSDLQAKFLTLTIIY